MAAAALLRARSRLRRGPAAREDREKQQAAREGKAQRANGDRDPQALLPGRTVRPTGTGSRPAPNASSSSVQFPAPPAEALRWLLSMLNGTAQTVHQNMVNGREAQDANRSAENGAGSQNGVAPVIISASSRPVTGPSVRPQCAWP